MLSIVSEELTNGAARVWGQELKWSGLGGSGGDDARVVHGSVLLQNSDDVGNGGSLLSDGTIDAVKSLSDIVGLEGVQLVDDAIDGDGGLASLSITNDELTLSSANWHKGVDGLESSHHRLVHRLSWDNTWCLELNSLSLITLNWALTVNWVTKSIDDSAEKAISDWHIDNGASSLDNISLLDLSIVTQDDDTDIVSLEVKSHTLDTRAELNHFTCLDLHETENTSNTITDGDDSTEFLQVVLLKAKQVGSAAAFILINDDLACSFGAGGRDELSKF